MVGTCVYTCTDNHETKKRSHLPCHWLLLPVQVGFLAKLTDWLLLCEWVSKFFCSLLYCCHTTKCTFLCMAAFLYTWLESLSCLIVLLAWFLISFCMHLVHWTWDLCEIILHLFWVCLVWCFWGEWGAFRDIMALVVLCQAQRKEVLLGAATSRTLKSNNCWLLFKL